MEVLNSKENDDYIQVIHSNFPGRREECGGQCFSKKSQSNFETGFVRLKTKLIPQRKESMKNRITKGGFRVVGVLTSLEMILTINHLRRKSSEMKS